MDKDQIHWILKWNLEAKDEKNYFVLAIVMFPLNSILEKIIYNSDIGKIYFGENCDMYKES